jgi:hypothetical protein
MPAVLREIPSRHRWTDPICLHAFRAKRSHGWIVDDARHRPQVSRTRLSSRFCDATFGNSTSTKLSADESSILSIDGHTSMRVAVSSGDDDMKRRVDNQSPA